MTFSDVDNEAAVLLKKANQRYTEGRRRLVAALQAGKGPLTIADIVAADDTLPQSSIYRNLVILEEANVVARVVTSDDFARYEIAEHLTHHHHHLICKACGDVIDFALDAQTEATLDQALHQAAHDAGFTAESHQLDLLGTCGDCRSES